jgi:aflatoxin B1 aldehyde reductase
MVGIKAVYGTAGAGFWVDDNRPLVRGIFELLKKYGVTTIDSAEMYGASETILGDTDAGSSFTIDTKTLGGFNAGVGLLPETLEKSAHGSIERLKMKQVDIWYIHAPDDTIPPSTWVPTVDKLYKEGLFKQFGLSNFSPKQVQEVYDAAKEGGYVLPTAFEGNYSPIARLQEDELFPLLRELKIAFYAYSPLAGGFLTKTKEDLLSDKNSGRFSKAAGALGDMYRQLYFRPAYLDALEEWAEAADYEGCAKAELAYRWVANHSPLKPEQGDAVIFAGSNLKQVEETLEGLARGPLKAKTVEMIEDVWSKVKHEAPLDNYQSFKTINA